MYKNKSMFLLVFYVFVGVLVHHCRLVVLLKIIILFLVFANLKVGVKHSKVLSVASVTNKKCAFNNVYLRYSCLLVETPTKTETRIILRKTCARLAMIKLQYDTESGLLVKKTNKGGHQQRQSVICKFE